MPQADLSYSTDLDFDPVAVLQAVEQVIKTQDDSAGACKGRAWPVAAAHHSHVLLRVAVLDKPHRDAPFRAGLVAALTQMLDRTLPPGTHRAVEVSFLSADYQTGQVPEDTL